MKKFALVSHVIPPSPSGQSIMLGKILAEFPAKDYVLLSASRYYTNIAVQNKLPGKTYSLPSLVDPVNFSKGLVRQIVEGFRLVKQVRLKREAISKTLKQERITSLVVCTGDFSDMAAGYLAAMRSPAIEFIPYYFDYFSYQFSGFYRVIASYLERQMMRRAKAVIVPNEFLQDMLEKRYGVTTKLVRNPHDNTNFPKSTVKNDVFTIVYTGAIYEAQLEPVLILSKAINQLGRAGHKVKFVAYTPDSEESLSKNGLTEQRSDAVLFLPPVSKTESQAKQASADMLYLPLAANTQYPEIIKSSCPGKMAEYLNSGVPIFAHVPDDSYVAWYLRKQQAGIVYSNMRVGFVVSKLKAILQTQSLLEDYTSKARVAAEDFNVHTARRSFKAAVSS